jgi:hypothetical protein
MPGVGTIDVNSAVGLACGLRSGRARSGNHYIQHGYVPYRSSAFLVRPLAEDPGVTGGFRDRGLKFPPSRLVDGHTPQ